MKIVLLLVPSLVYHSVFSMDSWNGQDYENNSAPQYESACAIIERDVKPLLKGSESILDVGCGTGRTTQKLASMIPAGSIKGIDLSKNMIDYANQKKDSYCTNLSFEVADVTELQEENKYDVVTSFLCLHWLKNEDKLKNEKIKR